MKKITILSIIALFCANAMAQPAEEIILKKWSSCIEQAQFLVEKHSKQTTAIMPNTDANWIDGSYYLENPPIVDWDSLFPGKWNVMTIMKKQLCFNMQCMLTNRGNETVLHCYLPLPADVVTNIWLASDETAIVDMETGIHYRARRTFPDSCMRKKIAVKAHNPVITNEKALGHGGDVVDFQIFFPKLPETTNAISIFGVPMWHLRGEQIQLERRQITKDLSNPYDDAPQFKVPRLVRAESNYDRNNHESWPAYTDAHLIKPIKDGTMALWRTREATYLAIAREQNWTREYFGIHGDTKLLTESAQCSLKEIIGLPTGHIFWIEGFSGDYFAYVLVFEPLPENATTFTFKEPDGEPFNMWGAHWGGQTIRNLNVNELRANQSLFEYNPRVIKE